MPRVNEPKPPWRPLGSKKPLISVWETAAFIYRCTQNEKCYGRSHTSANLPILCPRWCCDLWSSGEKDQEQFFLPFLFYLWELIAPPQKKSEVAIVPSSSILVWKASYDPPFPASPPAVQSPPEPHIPLPSRPCFTDELALAFVEISLGISQVGVV